MAGVLKDDSILINQLPTREVGASRESSGQVLFGAVYFRRTAPPRSDWERDYARAAADGHRIFRHWFVWNAISQGPGKYNWEPYDMQLDLAARYGIRTIIAEFIHDVPEWLYHAHPEARWERQDGSKRPSEYHHSCATGGLRSMCPDNRVIEEAAADFLAQMAERYKCHEGLYGYDIFNEYSLHKTEYRCYCPGTRQRFVEWLKKKYSSLDALREAWLRYSLSGWDDVEIPRQTDSYPDFYDLLEFHNDNAERWLRWRAEILREHDPHHLITAHGEALAFNDIAPVAADDWRLGSAVEISGYSQSSTNATVPVLLTGDLTRSSCGGKEFWHAEATGFPSWSGRGPDQVTGRRDVMIDPENIRLECMMSLMAGARAYINPRWRPLLDGPLFEAFGWYDRGGSPTDRSAMVSSLAKWAADPEVAGLWDAHPVRGEVGLLIVEEAQAFCYATYGDTGTTAGATSLYGKSYVGAHNAFTDSNIQADPIKAGQLDEYTLVYVPFPVALKDATVERLSAWAAAGGTLVLEGCPGYLNEMGHLMTEQPNRGFSEALGWKEISSHLGPDRWNDLTINSEVGELSGGVYRQVYGPSTGLVCGTYADGDVAIVSNAWGKGRILTVGSMPGYAYMMRPAESSRRWFAWLLAHSGRRPYLTVPHNTDVVARLHANRDNAYLWIVNRAAFDQRVRVYLDGGRLAVGSLTMTRGAEGCLQTDCVSAQVGRRDAAVIRLGTGD